MNVTKSYLKIVNNTPRLTQTEERNLTQLIRQGDARARRKLTRLSRPLVVQIATRYDVFGIPILKLIEEGSLGLMKAIVKFDPESGTRFSIFAGDWIEQHIVRYLSDKNTTYRIEPDLVESLLADKKFQKAVVTIRKPERQ